MRSMAGSGALGWWTCACNKKGLAALASGLNASSKRNPDTWFREQQFQALEEFGSAPHEAAAWVRRPEAGRAAGIAWAASECMGCLGTRQQGLPH